MVLQTSQHWFRLWLGTELAKNHYLNQYNNTDAYMRHSALVSVNVCNAIVLLFCDLCDTMTIIDSAWWLLMAWRLLAPGHQQPSCWLGPVLSGYPECLKIMVGGCPNDGRAVGTMVLETESIHIIVLKLWPTSQQSGGLLYTIYVNQCVLKLLYFFSNDCFHDIDGLMQERRFSVANVLKLRRSCANPSICFHEKTNIFSYLRNEWKKITFDGSQ